MTGYVCDIEWTDPHNPEAVDSVCVTGTFDNWTCSNNAERIGDGDHFKQRIVLPEREAIEFKFVINGCDWRVSDLYEIVHDEHGNSNNRVGPEAFVSMVESLSFSEPDSSGLEHPDPLDRIECENPEGQVHIDKDNRPISRNESGRQSPILDVTKHVLNFESIESQGFEEPAGVVPVLALEIENDMGSVPSFAVAGSKEIEPKVVLHEACEIEPNITNASEDIPQPVVPQLLRIESYDEALSRLDQATNDPLEDVDRPNDLCGPRFLENDNFTHQTITSELNRPQYEDVGDNIIQSATTDQKAADSKDATTECTARSNEETPEPQVVSLMVEIALGDAPINNAKTSNVTPLTNVDPIAPVSAIDSMAALPKVNIDETQHDKPHNAELCAEEAVNAVGSGSGNATAERVVGTVHDVSHGEPQTDGVTSDSGLRDEARNDRLASTPAEGQQNVRSLVDIALASEESERNEAKSTGETNATATGVLKENVSEKSSEHDLDPVVETQASESVVLIEAPLKGRLVIGSMSCEGDMGAKQLQADIVQPEVDPIAKEVEMPVDTEYLGITDRVNAFEKEGAPLPCSHQTAESSAVSNEKHAELGLDSAPVANAHASDCSAHRLSPHTPKLVFPTLHNFIPAARDRDPRARNSFLKQGTAGWQSNKLGPSTDFDSDFDENLMHDIAVPQAGPCQSSGSFAAVSMPTTSEDYHDLLRTLLSGSSHDDQFATPGGSVYTPHHCEDSVSVDEEDGESGNGEGDGDRGTPRATAGAHSHVAPDMSAVPPRSNIGGKLARSSLMSRIYNIFRS